MMVGRPSEPLKSFYHRCLHWIVGKGEALQLAEEEGIQTVGMKEGLGIIGAVAALGADFTRDQTFEIIAWARRNIP